MDFVEIREYAKLHRYPVMREETAKLLQKTAREKMPKRVLEIGTCIGLSGLEILTSCDCALTTVDTDAEAQERARKYFIEYGVADRAEIINEDCYNAMNLMKGREFDFVILDGPKGHYCELLDIIKESLTKGGILFADDIGFHGMTAGDGDPGHKHRTIVKSLREFIKKAEADGDLKVKIYDIEDGVAVIERIN